MPQHFKPRKNFGISRIDQPNTKTHGWRVRVHGCVPQLFSDGKYGSKAQSFEAAEAYRNSCFNTLSRGRQERGSKPLTRPAA
jgi:hypothetical protein